MWYNKYMENKIVLITGASGKIGSSIALTFAKSGYNVVICYNNSKEVAKKLSDKILSLGVGCLCQYVDISNADGVKQMVNDVISVFGHIDVLVNCAGIASYNILIDESDESIQHLINTNLLGTIYTSREVSKHMISRHFGKIINISSVWGNIGAAGESVYSASKGAINTFTKALAKELAYSNINVNAIAPGVVDSKMMSHFSNSELNQIKKDIPFGRFADPKEISSLALFLASDDASYITGQIIGIDGGFGL